MGLHMIFAYLLLSAAELLAVAAGLLWRAYAEKATGLLLLPSAVFAILGFFLTPGFYSVLRIGVVFGTSAGTYGFFGVVLVSLFFVAAPAFAAYFLFTEFRLQQLRDMLDKTIAAVQASNAKGKGGTKSS